jgi:hypothetical protein
METEILASTILSTFEEARSQLLGKSVVLTDGKAGTVENVWLDELHGLLVSIKGHDGKWPVSTVKLALIRFPGIFPARQSGGNTWARRFPAQRGDLLQESPLDDR